MWGQTRSEASILGSVVLILLFVLGAGCGKDKTAIVQITNKITTLPAGQTYAFTADVCSIPRNGRKTLRTSVLWDRNSTRSEPMPEGGGKHWTTLCMPSPNRSVPCLRVIGRLL